MASKSILLVAGEISGDMHAAAVVRAIQARLPGVSFFGVGGEELRRTGMEIVYDVRDMAVLGLTEVLMKYLFFRRAFSDIIRIAEVRRPDAVLLVDYPGFNLRLARQLHARGFKVLYYICPQVWAWNRGRIPEMARDVDRLLAIFPFETEVFRNSGLKVDFVGHPLVAKARAALEAPPSELPWNGTPRIALLPGSRSQEVRRILPPLWAAARAVERTCPGAGFLIAAPSEQVADWIREVLAGLPEGPAHCAVVVGRTREILRQARAAWVASGTATVETALMRCPMVVVYKTAWMTYWVGRQLIRVPFLGMVNIVAGRALCPELIQGDATPARLAEALVPLLADGVAREAMLEGLDRVRESLGDVGAEGRAADIVVGELQ